MMENFLEEVFKDYKIFYYKDKIRLKCNNSKRYLIEISKNSKNIGINRFIMDYILEQYKWETNEDDLVILKLIKPHLKFEGGTLIIPQLEKLDLIKKIEGVSIPSWLK